MAPAKKKVGSPRLQGHRKCWEAVRWLLHRRRRRAAWDHWRCRFCGCNYWFSIEVLWLWPTLTLCLPPPFSSFSLSLCLSVSLFVCFLCWVLFYPKFNVCNFNFIILILWIWKRKKKVWHEIQTSQMLSSGGDCDQVILVRHRDRKSTLINFCAFVKLPKQTNININTLFYHSHKLLFNFHLFSFI